MRHRDRGYAFWYFWNWKCCRCRNVSLECQWFLHLEITSLSWVQISYSQHLEIIFLIKLKASHCYCYDNFGFEFVNMCEENVPDVMFPSNLQQYFNILQAELKRLYTQLQIYKTKTMRKDNPHISKRRGGRKQTHRRFSLQVNSSSVTNQLQSECMR